MGGMALRSPSLLLLLSSLVTVSALSAIEADEEASLLAFKAAAIRSGYNDPLALWNRSTTGGYCSWEGVRCRGTRRRVVALCLPSLGLTGVLSPAVGNLSSLRILNLSYNGFSGNIPASLGRLRHLHTIDLSRNAFSGPLPTNLSSCTSLIEMVLNFNMLSGNMPSELGDKLKRLKVLGLQNNSFTGRIPASLANLTSLRILNLAFNLLEGTIPNSIGILKDLWYLALASNNLSGVPPTSLYNLSSLDPLQIQWNMLSGSIPTDIGSRFPSMQILDFEANQFTGTIPASLSNLTSLHVLHLAENMLSGYVPRTIGRLRDLQILDLYINMLQANDWEGWEFITSLSNCSQLQRLSICNNAAFTGHLPSSIVNLSTTLQTLRLDNTGIWGSIPSAIGNLVGLEILGIFNTSISGEIPDSIGKLANLTKLGLFNTNLSGQIPSSVGNLTKLAMLDAYHANLEGPIPPSIGKLKSIFSLDLSYNHLNGSIPRVIFELPLLTLGSLDFSYNSLSGPLPSEVGSLRNLNKLILSGNQLSGKIPESIGECIVLQELWLDNNLFNGIIPQYLNKGLTTLNLSVNKLSGTIPDAIGSISALEQLCLAYNNFSGPIPAVLHNLTSLSKLDLSFNDLQGQVPEEGIFRNLVNLSIIGNNKLCGGVPQLHLVPCKTDYVKKNINGKLKYLKIALPATFALLLLAIVIALLIYRKQRRKQKGALEPSMVEEQYERVSYHALSNGTNGFSEANLLGKGSFGTVYKCVFQAEGTVVAVKVFDLEQSGSTRSFVAECEALRRVRHRCLMKIITCCSSINEQEDMSARVGDFGISRIISESESMILQNSNSTIGIRGSIGYVAPEYGEGSSITTFGDVYSLGILLLEIFTGRSPTDDMFRGSIDLHKFSEDALPDKIWEIADTTMWLHTGTYDSNTRNIIEKCLVHVISLGVSCSRKQPRERTLIQDAVNEMHAIRDSYLKFARILVVQDGVGTIFL
ncbi:probable LRR receptor-like serine/threonine-protein kinase At3g47570 isoform X2 [Miscanthus floridulus]|uniref:probable LRR receptor-like serine/threonine-protein kinase At3g47570 isoform X2 n=1 Tax=Miscanthus floridulus TaxID=154761 RepID=UPI0034586E40